MISVVYEKATGDVVQMGLHDYAVTITDVATQAMVRLDVEKPTHLSEKYFRVVDGKLVDMTSQEKAQVDTKLDVQIRAERVQHLKELLALDPQGFREVLGL